MSDMAYSNNPFIPKVRAKAIYLVREEKWSAACVARHLGVHRSTVGRWLARAATGAGTIHALPTKSSRPKTSPNAIDASIVERILTLRDTERKNGPEAIHRILRREGVRVSFSSVYRTLKRHQRIKERSPWKHHHLSGIRPNPCKPGVFLQTDTIHIMRTPKERFYVYTLIDVYSRWAYAAASVRLGAGHAWRFVHNAQHNAPFSFSCIQSDHGPEFSSYFTRMAESRGIRHRHSRVCKPNDNAHIERFNRTIQEELYPEIRKYKNNISWLNRSINAYLVYYNTRRLHAGIHHNTPMEYIQLLQRS